MCREGIFKTAAAASDGKLEETLFPGEFTFEGNRAIDFDVADTVPAETLAFCIAAALTYQRH